MAISQPPIAVMTIVAPGRIACEITDKLKLRLHAGPVTMSTPPPSGNQPSTNANRYSAISANQKYGTEFRNSAIGTSASANLEPRFAAELSLELARYFWRLNQPDLAVQTLETALPDLHGNVCDEAIVNLGAALVRVGRLEEAVALLETVVSGASHGWALAHCANAQRFAGQLVAAIVTADLAYRAAVADEDGFLAVSALCVKGEALLETAVMDETEPLEATIAFGKAFGITEMLGEEASAAPLAGLAHAQAVWGNQQKALEQAEKAFKRARAAKDSASVIRALLALYATTRIGSFARNALSEASAYQHKPLELLATLAVLEKDADSALAAHALELARLTGNAALEARAIGFNTVESSL